MVHTAETFSMYSIVHVHDLHSLIPISETQILGLLVSETVTIVHVCFPKVVLCVLVACTMYITYIYSKIFFSSIDQNTDKLQ